MHPSELADKRRREILKGKSIPVVYVEVWLPLHLWEAMTQHLRYRSRGRWLREVALARLENPPPRFDSYRAQGTVTPQLAHRAKVPLTRAEREAMADCVGNLSRYIAGVAEAQAKQNGWLREDKQ